MAERRLEWEGEDATIRNALFAEVAMSSTVLQTVAARRAGFVVNLGTIHAVLADNHRAMMTIFLRNLQPDITSDELTHYYHTKESERHQWGAFEPEIQEQIAEIYRRERELTSADIFGAMSLLRGLGRWEP